MDFLAFAESLLRSPILTPSQMSLARAVSSTLRCNGCRVAVIRSFASLSGSNVRIPDDPFPQTFRARQGQRRAFTTGAVSRADLPVQDEPGRPEEKTIETEELVEEQNEGRDSMQEDSAVPWYLQLEDQTLEAAHPLAERQRLPDLPEDPPPILQQLLEYISVEAGLDDLSLFDLRHLDPPPALGSNLIMILGSARSEKHLHVSADRFSRWLRSTHKLSPHADGLLGRNELKIKLRRKAKRMKLLANAGAAETTALDDGIRTGWICVTVGRVAPAPDAKKRFQPQHEGFVGFGSESDDVNIVVQMFTEEKRLDIDLEGLWGRVLQRAAKEKETGKTDEQSSSAAKEDRRRLDDASMGRIPASYPSHQIRSFHTGVRPRPSIFSLLPPIASPSIRTLSSSRIVLQISAADAPEQSAPDIEVNPERLALDSALAMLKAMAKDDAIRALGSGRHDRDSTDFLRSFNENISLYASTPVREAEIELCCYAYAVGHPGYQLQDIRATIDEVQLDAPPLSEGVLKSAFKAILSRPDVRDSLDQAAHDQALEQALYILDLLHDNHHSVLTEDIVMTLHEALSPNTEVAQGEAAALADPEAAELKLQSLHGTVAKRRAFLRSFMSRNLITVSSDSTWQTLLLTSARLGDVDGLWETWRAMARRMYPRGRELYMTMFESVLAAGDRKECENVLRRCVPEMELEVFPVRMDSDLAELVRECLVRVEPRFAEGAWDESQVDVHWVRLWRRCTRVLRGVGGDRDFKARESL